MKRRLECCVQEPVIPLLLSKSANLFKLFVLPIEVKSGKAYTRHQALDHVLTSDQYEIDEAIVFCNENIHMGKGVFYCPVYLAGLLKKEENLAGMIYSLDLSVLQ